MHEVTQILTKAHAGDAQAAAQLLPLVYDELRRLAAHKLHHEAPDHTLQPTALVHEAYLRLVGADAQALWDSRGHFFAAAAESMRRILVDEARRKKRVKHGGGLQRVELDEQQVTAVPTSERILALDEALDRLAEREPMAAQVVKLHFFAGLSLEQVGECLGISRASAKRQWAYARAWLRCATQE